MTAHTVLGDSADQVWRAAAQEVLESGQIQPSRAGLTREVRQLMLEIKNPNDRVVFARPINPAFGVAEVIWILAGANDSAFLEFWNPRMVNYVDKGQSQFHGAYGHRLGCQPRLSYRADRALRRKRQKGASSVDQVRRAEQALRVTPDSRQVVLQVWDRDLDLPDPMPRSVDVPCNVVGHLLVRRGRLEWLQVMRSTDIVWGLPYNLIQWTTLQEVVAGWLGLKLGPYVHLCSSLHAYQRHWEPLKRWTESTRPAGLPKPQSLMVEGYENWESMFSSLVDTVLDIASSKTKNGITQLVAGRDTFPPAYREWIALLGADALRRRGFAREARGLVWDAGRYWATSWLSWEGSRSRLGRG